MTNAERKMLYEIHDALLGVPHGPLKDEKPLLEDIRHIVRAYNRFSWLGRSLIWFLPMAAGIGIAFDQLKNYFK